MVLESNKLFVESEQELVQTLTIFEDGTVEFVGLSGGNDARFFNVTREVKMSLKKEDVSKLFEEALEYLEEDDSMIYYGQGHWYFEYFDQQGLVKEVEGSLDGFKDDQGRALIDMYESLLPIDDLWLFGYTDRLNKLEIKYRKKGHDEDLQETLEINRDRGIIKFEKTVQDKRLYTQTIQSDEKIAELLDYLYYDNLFKEFHEEESYIYDDEVVYTYNITLEFERQASKTIDGTYDRMHLPKDYEQIMVSIILFYREMGLNDMMDDTFYLKALRRPTDYIYVSVNFSQNGMTYYYLTEDPKIKIGDDVLVPMGINNMKQIGRVQAVSYHAEEDVPYPLDKTKSVIKVVKDRPLEQYKIKYGVETILEKEVALSDLDDLVNYGWEVYLNEKTRYYPVVDMKSDIEVMYKHAFMLNQLWVVEIDGALGILPLIVDNEYRFIQANGGVATKDHFDKIAAYFEMKLKEKYRNYTYVVGYPETNDTAIKYCNEHNYTLHDALIRYENRLSELDYHYTEYNNLNADNFDAFKSFHDLHFPDDYWNADLIWEHQDRWVVVLEEAKGEIVGATGAIVYEKNDIVFAEVYFQKTQSNLLNLIHALLSALEDVGVEIILHLVHMVDEETKSYLKQIGFKTLSFYYGYTKRL